MIGIDKANSPSLLRTLLKAGNWITDCQYMTRMHQLNKLQGSSLVLHAEFLVWETFLDWAKTIVGSLYYLDSRCTRHTLTWVLSRRSTLTRVTSCDLSSSSLTMTNDDQRRIARWTRCQSVSHLNSLGTLNVILPLNIPFSSKPHKLTEALDLVVDG
jgi:hypothetical protein